MVTRDVDEEGSGVTRRVSARRVVLHEVAEGVAVRVRVPAEAAICEGKGE